VGAPGLDNIETIDLLSIEAFKEEFKIDLSRPTILFTFHPETINPERNEEHIKEIISALQNAERYQILITGTNADTHNSLIRRALSSFSKQYSGTVQIIENLGTRGYFSAMKHCSFLMGNTSSGIIEAASLGAKVINLGDRQKGRIAGSNVVTVPVQRDKIASAIQEIEKISAPVTENIYWSGGAAVKIIQILKRHFGE
jgi:GDP/UDP-N,N'-diacetylbacillosamine 2-epimerase (hydrolysing)